MTSPVLLAALMAVRAGLRRRVCRVGASLLWAALATLEVQAQVNATPFDYTRTSAFTYTAAGLLETETIEPSVAQACVTTKYVYDGYGNRVSAITANTGPNAQCVNAPSGLSLIDSRASSTTFAAQTGADPVAPAGTFATTATNALGQQEQRVWDARFGVAIKLTGPNTLTTTWTLDSFGRKVLETRADATSTLVRYCLIALAVSDTTSNSAGCANPAVGEAPSGAVRYEHTEPQLSSTKIGAYTRVYYDAAGRKLRSITEAFDADTEVSPANPNRLIAQDTSYNQFGAVDTATQPYFMDTKSSLPKAAANGGNAQYGMSRTDYDILGRPIAVYTTDPAVANGVSDPPAPRQTGGTEAGVVFNGQSYLASKTSIGYAGLDTVTTTPVTTPTGVVNRVRYEHKNPDGKVVASTDHYGAQVAHQHDAFGNLVATKDALGNQINIDYDVRGRKLKLNDPDAGVTVYCYDALGQLKAQQTSAMRANHAAPACPAVAGTGTVAPTAAGWTTMAYDLLGRMSERIDADMPNVATGYKSTWTYDTCTKGIGKLCKSTTSHGVSRKYAYDNLGRPISARTDVLSGISAISGVSYDGNGRVDTQTFPSGLKVSMAYTARGYLLALRPVTSLAIALPAPGSSLTNAQAYWTAKSVNAWGKVEVSGYSNGVNNRSIFEPITGRLLQLTAGTNLASGVVDQRYGWDNAGQLTARIDQLGDGNSGTAVADTYRYDNLGRLKDTTVSGNASPLQRTVELHYNALGMLLYKSDVGSYTYPAQGPATANSVPHGVRSISGTHNAAYTYDTNGSVITATGGKYRAVAYNSFNMPDSNAGMSGAGATPKYTWQYDENHQRIKETRLNASGSRVTWSLHPDNLGGLAFEREEGATPSNRHFISAGGMTIGVIVTTGAMPALSALDSATDMTVTALASLSATKLEYWHKDHLGSLIATTNQDATVTLRLAYDAFGKRRHTSSAYDVDGNLVIDWSTSPGTAGPDRGYTGHEHLDDLGVIHMNGRIFDPLIARFMQADPLIQDPLNLQNFDRYGYCYNNPLTCTDPSGYFSLRKLFKFAVIALVGWYVPTLLLEMMANPAAYSAFGLANGIAANTAGQFLFAQATSGFVIGAVTGGSLQSGIQGAFSAGIFFGAGELIAAGGVGGAAFAGAEQVAIHGVAGCIQSIAGGGKCGPGALSAAFSKTLVVNGFTNSSNPIEGAIKSAVAGGVGSVLGGGKFANGAQTGAFSYLFNHCGHVQGGCWSALKDAASMTADWATGRGADTRVFGPGSIQVIDMMDAPGVNDARAFFYNKNSAAIASGSYGSLQSVTNYGAGFGLTDLFTNSSPTQQFVGSYRVDVWPVNNGSDVMFVLNNNSSFKSFGYGVAPAWERSTFGPAGNMRQTYWWIEPRKP